MRFSLQTVRVLAAVLSLAVLVGSCATGRGDGFAREAAKERKSHNNSKDKGDSSDDSYEDEEQSPTLTIVTTPSTAKITVDGRYAGTGSTDIDSFGLGQKVVIKVEAPSYRTKTLSVALWGQTETLRVDLEPILGTLELTGDLTGAKLSLSNDSVAAGRSKILIGHYELKARRFGFQDVTQSVTIEEDKTTTVEIVFQTAPFDLTDLKNDRTDGFNPDSAAIAATAQLSFFATAPGHATLTVRDSKGVERARWDYPRLDTWYQEVHWDGRQDGVSLPDGRYTVTLAGGPDGADTVTRTIKVRIDRSLIDRDRASIGPAPGLLWTPTPEVLSPGTIQASFLGLGHQEGGLAHVPVSASLRGSPAHGWELSGQTSMRLWSQSSLNSFYATFAVKRRIAVDSPDFRLAWIAGGTLGTWLTGDPGIPPTDFLTTFPAIHVLFPASWSWGKWTLMVAPEADMSFWSPSTAYVNSGDAAGTAVWGYGRVGLSYDPGPFTLAFSGVGRTPSLGQGWGWMAPAHLGFEGRYPIPDTPVTLGGYLSVSAYSSVDYAWYGGLGFSLLLPASLTLDLVSQVVTSP